MKITTRFSVAVSLLSLLGLFCPLSNSGAGQVLVWGSYSYSPALTNVPASATNVVQLAAGDAHCLALKADGTVVAWGGNYAGQTNVPTGLTNVASVAAGSSHSLVLRNDGTLALWGQFSLSPAKVIPSNATNIVAVASGPGAPHAVVLRADGTVLDWGNNSYSLTNIPVLARNIVAVAAGADYGLALRSDGRPVAWGSGPLGFVTPVPTAATNIVAIASGWYGNAGLRSDGTVLTWGSAYSPPTSFTNVMDLACPISYPGNSDILALRRNGTMVEYSTFSVPTYPTNNITAIAAGSFNAFAVVGSGPPVFPGRSVNRSVAAGSRAYLRMMATGAMPISYQWLCAGTNLPGATNSVLVLTNVQPNLAGNIYSLIATNTLGMATSGPVMLSVTPSEAYIQSTTLSAVIDQPVTFTASTVGQGPFTYQWQLEGTNLLSATNLVFQLTGAHLSDAGRYSIVASNSWGLVTNYISLAVAPSIVTNWPQNQTAFPGGTAAFNLGVQAIIPVSYRWQFNSADLEGATDSSLILTNVQYSQGGTYSVIFVNSFETVTNSATLAIVPVAAWGYSGQRSLPSTLTNVIAIASGDYYGLALAADGTVIGWGNNSTGGATAPPGLSNVVAVATGYYNSLALKSDSTITAWGIHSYVPAGLTNIVTVATGDDFNMVLKSDGTVVAWGGNAYGQTNVPANLTNIVAIAASDYCSMALRADGTVFAWGMISNVPPSVTNAVQIATSGLDDLVLQADGSIIGWGSSNSSGQDSMPPGLSNVVAIAASYSQSAALKADGTVFAWGANQYGQTNVPTGLTNVIELCGGSQYQDFALIGSGPPTLAVTVSNCLWTASGFQCSLPSQSGRVYALEYTDSLTNSSWSALPLAAGNRGMLTLTDPAVTNTLRFYRVCRW